MVNFINIDYNTFINEYSKKKIICIGAGGTFRDFVRQHMDKINLLDSIDIVLDNNKALKGESISCGVRLTDIDYLPEYNPGDISTESHIIFVTLKNEYIIDVINQIDKYEWTKGMDCVYAIGTFNWGYSFYPLPRGKMNDAQYSEYKYLIPKNIHYCWFGKEEIPEKDRECIDSWSRNNPEYNIIYWNEDNYNINCAPEYVKCAYEAGKYAFVSDYVRLDVVYQYGGFYLDTDVELFDSLDELRNYRMVFAYMEYGEISTGLGFGSIPKCKELFEMMREYQSIPFVLADGNYNETPCPRYTNDYFRRKGVYPDNTLCIKDDILFLPSDYLCPLAPVACGDGSFQLALLYLTDNTKAIHWCNNTWKSSDALKIYQDKKNSLHQINDRLLSDWKKRKGLYK